MIKTIFSDLCSNYSNNTDLINKTWISIETHYSEKKRFYHTLTHLEYLYGKLFHYKQHIDDWDTILFTMFFHDIIYNTKKSNNEEKSAEFAKAFLKELDFPLDKINRCNVQITATKSHEIQEDSDSNIFNDMDLFILSEDWDTYCIYTQQIRNEYSIYPTFIYRPGRVKVLQHFLKQKQVFKSSFLDNSVELQARANILKEIAILQQ